MLATACLSMMRTIDYFLVSYYGMLEDIQEDMSDMFVCLLLWKTKQHHIVCLPVDEADKASRNLLHQECSRIFL